MGMIDFVLPWEEDTADPLSDQCVRKIIADPTSICDKKSESPGWKIKNHVALPTEMCEKILKTKHELALQDLNDEFVTIFEDLQRTRLRHAFLKSSKITDEGLLIILKHNVMELDIRDCENLKEKSLGNIMEHCKNLLSLSISQQVLSSIPSSLKEESSFMCFKSLQKLVINDYDPVVNAEASYLFLLEPLSHLVYLDLSGCTSIGDLDYITHMEHLKTLLLYNVRITGTKAISSICKLKSLRKLDLSQVYQDNGKFKQPDETLQMIAQELPLLTHLDISGTNLCGRGSYEPVAPDVDGTACDIAGLQCRARNPLDFLGLYNTHYLACQRYSIPAEVIAGEANEEQVLAATEAYMERPKMLIKAMNELFLIFRYEHCVDYGDALRLVLHAMSRHKDERNIQISGSASLFYITKNEKNKLTFFARRKLITVLLDGMERHMDDPTMMRNGCLTFCQFRMPHDMIFNYKRLVNILLFLVKGTEQGDEFVRRIAIFILNTLACQVDGQHKLLVGDLGAIETMLSLIKERLNQNSHDDLLDIAWSAMWNVTDETPLNCERFLDGSGMTYFLKCLEAFPNKEELLRNMMGLLGNVAEVKHLRPRMLDKVFISTFADLLDSHSDGIEVSYNAAGVLSHIMSDGIESWNIAHPSRDEVLRKIVEAISKWDINSKRNINYRSFGPILRMLQVEHTPECQHWAAWALANLTKMYPAKYCRLLEMENGIALLESVIENSNNEQINELASLTLSNCDSFKRNPLELDETST